MKFLMLLTGLISFTLQGVVLSREDVIYTALPYAYHPWSVNAINTRYPIYSIPGLNIHGEAYSFGNKHTPPEFDTEIAAGKIPRNWQDNYSQENRNQYTGIDCSGFVSRSFKADELVDWIGSSDWPNYTIEVEEGEQKEGDVWCGSGHVFLEGEFGYKLEANPRDDPIGGNRVQFLSRGTRRFTARSIFPQFRNVYPSDKQILDDIDMIDISLRINVSGSIAPGGVRMFITRSGEGEEFVGETSLTDEGDNTWEFKKEDFDVSEGGEYTVRIIARNDVTIAIGPGIVNNGYKDEYSWSFIVNQDSTPPMVVSTDPSDGTKDVSIDKTPITITFSKPMDPATTTPAVSAPFGFTTSWDGDKTINLHPNDYLEYCEDYSITITDNAMSKDGVQLDGNSDGDAGDPYIFTLTTEAPDIKLTIDPAVANIRERNSISPDVITNGSELKKEIDCNMDFDTHNPGGWSVSGLSDPSFSLSPGGTHEDNFTVTNSGASAALRVTCEIPRDCGDIISAEGYYWSEEGHRKDHPDENQSPGKMEYPTPWLIRTQSSPAKTTKIRGVSPGLGLPDIGILLSGWADGYGHILGRYGIETLPIKPDLKILNNPDVDISDAVKLLVIGSAGLKGFNSPTFKQDLEDYVVNGGNLLMGRRFTQILWI